MAEENKQGSLIRAVLCGFLIAFNVVLFMNYFLDVNVWPASIVWFIAIDLGFVFIIAYPFDVNGVIALTIFLLILGYAAYGPYATYLRGPMGDIKESLSDLPGMAEKQIHCLSLIFTNHMAYQQECVISKQPKGPEEEPEDYGIEIMDFEMQPDTEIYGGMPMQIWMTLENMGSYDANNVLIKSDAGEYDECDLEILNIDEGGINGNYSEKIRKETNHYYSVRGKINDPWKEDCTYAKNKMVIGGNIKTTYSYDYQTESYLEIEAIKNVNESEPEFRVESAKEKAAPANILMYTFVPLIFEGAGEGYKEALIPISFQNERRRGKIIFRGKYVKDNVLLAKGVIGATGYCTIVCLGNPACLSECTASYMQDKIEYNHCEVVSDKENEADTFTLGSFNEEECNEAKIKALTNEKEEYIGCEIYVEIETNDETDCTKKGGSWKEDICKKIEKIDVESKELCERLNTKIIYKVFGNYKRSNYDKITIYLVGDIGEYVNLECGEDSEDEIVICNPGTDKLELIWVNNELDLKPNEKKFVYSGVKVKLTNKFPSDAINFNFGIKADTTYRVEMETTDNLQIKNRDYTN